MPDLIGHPGVRDWNTLLHKSSSCYALLDCSLPTLPTGRQAGQAGSEAAMTIVI